MKLQDFFKDVFHYAASMETWVNNQLPLGPLKYTFAGDFAIADWYGANDVQDTYERVKESWLPDYKAFTEVVIALNMLSWANVALKKANIESRDKFVSLYSELYHRATSDFYDKHRDNREACDYFFRMTD